MAITSLVRWATKAAASLPSTVIQRGGFMVQPHDSNGPGSAKVGRATQDVAVRFSFGEPIPG